MFSRRPKPTHCGSPRFPLKAVTLTLGALAAIDGAAAQQQLPGIVVQGATLDVRPSRSAVPDDQGVASDAAGQTNAAAVTTGSGGSADIAGVPADKLGTSLSVITGAQLRQQNVRNVADALRSLPGVHVSSSGGPQSLTVIRLRGAESNHTLVRIDGVEVNPAGGDGFFDFSTLTTEDIEQIEVLRGPQSGLYGAGAIGGVINIITKQGKGPLTLRARAEAGSFNTRDGSLQLSGGDDRLHGSLTLHGRRTDGFNVSLTGNEEDFGQFSTFSFTGGVRVFENLKVDGTLRRSTTRGGRDNGFGGVLNGFAVPADDLSFFETGLWVGRLQTTLDTFDGRWVHKLYVNQATTKFEDTTNPPSFGAPFTESTSENRKYGYTSTYRIDGPSGTPVRHFMTGLIEREEETFVQPTSPVDPTRKERQRTGVVGEMRGEYVDTLFLTGTVRRDDNKVFDDFTTWRTTASLKVPHSPFRLHGSYGTGVKYPSFSEQFGFFFGFLPNPSLQPEESRGWDIGVETSMLAGRAAIDVTYFNQNLTNEIDFRTVPVFQFQPFNRDGESTRKGVEVTGRYLVTPGLTLGAAYTWLDARESDGREEIRRPRHSGRFDLNYAFDKGRANVNFAAQFNGRMQDIVFDAGPPFGSAFVALDDYWLLSAAASYKVHPGVELYGRIENLLDQQYQEIFGFNTAGLAAYAGVRFTYEGKPSLASAAR